MSKIEFTKEGWAILNDDYISCSQDVRVQGRIDFDVFGSLDVCRPYWREGTTVIDIGAQIGCWSVPMGLAVGPKGLLVAFEGDPEPFSCLSHNVKRHPEINAKLINAAVWDTEGEVIFLRNMENRGASAVSQNGMGESLTIQTVTMPSVRLDDLDLENVSFIKIDVEGAEFRCLKGAEKLITDQRPIIFAEILDHAQRWFGGSLEEMLTWLEDRGYELKLYPLGQPPHDVLCVPRS
jgi:FkbM family methyltransferase